MHGSSTEDSRGKGKGSLRLGLLALALLLAATAYSHREQRRNIGEELQRDAASTGAATRHPELATDLAREPSAVEARLLLARAILADELDPSWVGRLPPGERQQERKRSIERLELARRLATDAMAHQPASWEAAMILGGSRYLEGRRKDDANIYYDKKPWLDPLEASERLGPGQLEPLRFRAAATLDSWFSLTPAGRRDAEDLLRRAFQNPDTFDLLAASWLAAAPSPEVAYSLVPDQAEAWKTVETIYARERDWAKYEMARRRWFDALHDQLKRDLAKGEEALATGRNELARATMMSIVHQAPPDQRFATIIDLALKEAPPGLANSSDVKAFKGWLDWTLDQCQIRDCPLSESVIGRLAAGVDDLSIPEAAFAALAAGNLPRAERLERRAQSLWGEGWNAYWIFKAETAARQGEMGTAHEALQQVDPSLQSSPTYRRATLILREAEHHDAGRAAALGDIAAQAWNPIDWRFKAGRPSLTLVTGSGAQQIEISIASAPRNSLVSFVWDGQEVAARPVHSKETVTLTVAVDRYELHRLEIRPLAGGNVVPGAVQLVGA